MNLGLENLEHLLKMESNKSIFLTRIIATGISSFISQRVPAEPIIFSILKVKSDINFQDKNLDIDIKSAVLNGDFKGQLQQFSSENIRNGPNRNSRLYDNITDPTNVLKRERSRESARPDRKKTKFLKEWYCQ